MNDAIYNHERSKIADLIEGGANINETDEYGRTPLFTAAYVGLLDVVEYLIEHGADPNIPNNHNETPLYIASFAGRLDIVRYLIENNADPNIVTSDDSPLSAAERYGHYHVAKYLIKMGADTSTLDRNSNLFKEVLRDETNKLKKELTQNYISIEKGSPQTITAEGKIKSLIPKNLLLKTIYEKPYQEYCSSVDGELPPIQLIALANILKLDYNIDISWSDLCDRIKNILYLLL